MTTIIEYDFYQNNYYGELSESDFRRARSRAINRIEMLIGGELESPSDRTKTAICYMIDLVDLSIKDTDFKSESEGNYSYTKKDIPTKKAYYYENAISLLKYEGYEINLCIRS